MASRASIIACGTRMAFAAMGIKFLVGPALMAVSSTSTGLRGVAFRTAIVQVRIICVLQCIIKSDIRLTNLQFNAGSPSSRNCSICFCQRVQCTSRHIKHRVKEMLQRILNLTVHIIQLESKNCSCFGYRVIFGMLIALPIALAYYFLLALQHNSIP